MKYLGNALFGEPGYSPTTITILTLRNYYIALHINLDENTCFWNITLLFT